MFMEDKGEVQEQERFLQTLLALFQMINLSKFNGKQGAEGAEIGLYAFEKYLRLWILMKITKSGWPFSIQKKTRRGI